MKKSKGIVLGVIGGRVLAAWNATRDQHTHALRACQCALAMRQILAALRPPVRVHIGIWTDMLLVGNISTSVAASFHALGPAFLRCWQLASLNQQLGTGVLLTAETASDVRGHFVMRGADNLAFAKPDTKEGRDVVEVLSRCCLSRASRTTSKVIEIIF